MGQLGGEMSRSIPVVALSVDSAGAGVQAGVQRAPVDAVPLVAGPAGADGPLSLRAAVGVGGAGPALQAGVVEAAVEGVAEPAGGTLADGAVALVVALRVDAALGLLAGVELAAGVGVAVVVQLATAYLEKENVQFKFS